MSSPIISQDSNIKINQSLPQRIAIYVNRYLRSNITKQQLNSYVKRNATQRGIVVVSMLSVAVQIRLQVALICNEGIMRYDVIIHAPHLYFHIWKIHRKQ